MSDALSWAERLANGEAAPEPSALEWAEGLAAQGDETPAAVSSPNAWPTPSAAAPAPATRAGGPMTPFGPTGGSPFGGTGSGAPAAPPAAAAEAQSSPAPRSRAELRSRKELREGSTRASRREQPPSSPVQAVPPPGEPAPAKPAAEVAAAPARNRRSGPGKDARSGRAGKPDRAGTAERAGKSKARPQGAPAGPGRRNVRRVLAKGLPRAADRPTVLVVAAVVAVGLGLGVGWTTNYFGSGKNLAAATPVQCAAAQTAWTKAANAQTGVSEENPASLRSGFIDARDAMASASDVPEAIATDWEYAHTFYATIADAIEKKDPGDAAGIVEAAAAASGDVDTDTMLETSARITRYVNSDCNA
ncbi:hypothetical protein [Myceligenerans crystallogenes]|uniref:Meckel syndrome type 1 protein n=1 Tax=Myceligenerans crystallogenes TaxID=316335 RepID=A0ABN2N5T2_9MICO